MSDSQSPSSLERLRDHVIEQLTNGYSRDYLSEEEFEQRVEKATGARTHHELRALLIDLPLAGAPNAPVLAGENRPAVNDDVDVGYLVGDYLVNRGSVESESTAIAIFSSADRKGVWDPPRTLNVIAIFGGSDVDLREARIPAGGMTINAVAMFGGIDVIVPEGVNVVTSGAGIFGGFEHVGRRGDADPHAPTVKVEGVAIFGGVDVKIKRRK